MTAPLVADMLQSVMTTKLDGDANAWRAEIEIVGKKEVVYLAADRGVPKVIGTPSAPIGVGRHILRLLGKHDDAAMRLLDWAIADGARTKELARIWGGTLPRDPKMLALSAAILADDADGKIVKGKLCGATTTDGQFVCDMVVYEGCLARRQWDTLLAHATDWAARAPSWAAPFPLYAQTDALIYLGRLDEAEHLIDDALAKHKDDVELLWRRTRVAIARHKLDEAAVGADAVVQVKPDSSHLLNGAAWLKVTLGVAYDSALEQARHAAEVDKRSAAIANTLAAAEAETDHLRDAVKHVQHTLDLRRADADSSDWYVIGRIREKAGLRDDAIAAYRRVKKAENVELTPSVYELATARLKALGASKK